MSAQSLVRWSGALLMVAAVLRIVAPFIRPDVSTVSQALVLSGAISVGSLVLFLMALPALFVHSKTGPLGLLGVVLLAVGSLLTLGVVTVGTTVVPAMLSQANGAAAVSSLFKGPLGTFQMVSFGIASLGYLFFGAAMLRNNQLPRWATLGVLIGGFLGSNQSFIVPLTGEWIRWVNGGLLGLGMLGFGLALWNVKAMAESTLQAKGA